MRKPTISTLLLLLLLVSGTFVQVQAQPFNPKEANYLWPTEASPYLSATFAETRSRHFHAALDIKTWGRRGYKVYATREGVVHRIAIGPTGYGKVIYLRHPDDSYSIYAHLMGFNDTLQQMADSIRIAEDYAFELDEFVGDRHIKVQQGDVIGYSGASGIGPPHLHFELRTPAHKPFNPLLTNLSVVDNIAPQFVGLSIEPRSVRSSVEGSNNIKTKRAYRKGGQYRFGQARVSGPVGLGVNVFDQSDDVHNVYAVYELSMSVNGKEFFKAQPDSFSYLQTHQMFIDRVYPLLQEKREGYQRLFVADGNSLPFYQADDINNGVLDLPPGSHQVKIRATDFFGNTSTAALQLEVEEPDVRYPDLSNIPSDPADSFTTSPTLWKWFDNWVTIPTEDFRQLTIASTDSSNFFIHGDDIGIKLKDTDPLFMNIPGEGPTILRRIVPESNGILSSVNQEGFAHFPRETFYDTVSLGMTVQTVTSDSITAKVFPDAYPLRKPYQIRVSTDSTLDTSQLSFYKWDRRHSEWDLVSTEFTDNFIIGETQSLGQFTTLRDTLPPVIRRPRLQQRRDGQWIIYISATDNLSGIDHRKTEISVNGLRGIAEYEPEDDRLVYYHPEFTPSSALEIVVTAFDKMGNHIQQTLHLKTGSGTH